MTTTGMYKLDDGTNFPTNCFPARSLLRPRYQEGAGHWQVARWTAEQAKMEMFFDTKHPRVKWKGQGVLSTSHLDEKTLDRAQLIKIHRVKTPSDLCSVNISNQNFVSAKEEDFKQFTSVAYVTATENLLTLGAFRTFPELRELELSLNGLRYLKINVGDFPHLEVLDLSYNNLSPEDVQVLGVLPQLKVLHLTANGLNSLPSDMAIPESKSCPKFPALEVLLLDDNHLSHPDVFVSLANLRSLKQLNLDKNGIRHVPYLHYISNSRFSIHPLSAKSGIKEGLRSRKTARKQLCQDGFKRVSEKPEYIILQSTKDPNKTEVVLPSWSPEPTGQEDSVPTGDAPKTSSASGVRSDFMFPLPELRFLSLADNQIEHEEDLLAVALFPSLTELTFYGNPFTTSRSGDPPLLTSFLQNKLGIKMVRKKISKLEKPRVFIPIKANRKITSRLPKVRKHRKMIGAPPETTFWQLWTGDDLLETRKDLPRDGSLPLPVIRSVSTGTTYCSDFQILSTLEKGDISRPYSREGSFSEVTSLSSDDRLLAETSIRSRSSLDQILFEDVPEAHSSLEQMLFEPLPPSVKPQLQVKFAPLTEPHLMEQVQPKPVPLAQDRLEPVMAVQMPSTESDLSESISPISGLLPPPNSPLQQEDLAVYVPASQMHAQHHDLPETLVTFEQDPSQPVPPSPNSFLPEQSFSIPDLSTEPGTEEWSIAESFPPDSSLSEEDLPEDFPTTGSPAVKQHQLELMAQRLDLSELSSTRDVPGTGLPASFPEGQVPEEPVPPARSVSQAEDLSKPLPPVHLLPEQDQMESVPSPISSVQGQNPFESVPPGGLLAGQQGLTGSLLVSAEPHLPQTSIPRRSLPEDQPLVEPGPPTSSASQETSQMETEPYIGWPPTFQESLRNSPTTTSFPSSRENLLDASLPLEPPTTLKDPLQSISSKELYQIFARLYQEHTPARVSPNTKILSSRGDLLETEKTESFFITQGDEASGRSLEPQTSRDELMGAFPAVPEKYRGYEELLGKDPGPDFIEPVGIQHNVQALEKALRYPRVYRDSKARLDSIQKRYVPTPKKVLRVLPQQPQQDKVERLEDILLRLRDPTNIVHMPLVCILQKKKENWREYREALALLKEFREEYKATVAACQEDSESKSRRLSGADQKNRCQFGPLPEIKVSTPDSDPKDSPSKEPITEDSEESVKAED